MEDFGMSKQSLGQAFMLFAVALVAIPAVLAADIEVNDECSLADAIYAANYDIAAGACPPGEDADTIILPANSMITLANEITAITTDMTIQGNGAIVDAAERFRIFDVTGDVTVTLNDLTLQNGRAEKSSGGAIKVVAGTVIASHVTLQSNYAAVGGAIGADNGTVILNNCHIKGNSADLSASAIWIVNGGALEVNRSVVGGDKEIDANWTTLRGATIDIDESTVAISDSAITNNRAQRGAISILSGSLTIVDSTIAHNSAEEDGAAIRNLASDLEITRSVIKENIAAGYGGALFSSSGSVTITDSKFLQNESGNTGGAIYSVNDMLSIANSRFSKNSAAFHGGALFVGKTMLELRDSVVEGNTAEIGGGISAEKATAIISGSTIAENTAQSGGGIANRLGSLEIEHSVISNNSASAAGGGIVDNYGEIRIANSQVSGNVSQRGGRGLDKPRRYRRD